MHELIDRLCLTFSNRILRQKADAADLKLANKHIAFSTDSYVVRPLFFPGGDIGKLAVFGTVNDLSMQGAWPRFISLSFIIEEGLEFSLLEKITQSIRQAALKSKVLVVTGDIKVVERGAADKIFINTSGIGDVADRCIGTKAKVGDAIIINGSIAEHGMAVLEARENFGFTPRIKSDCTNVNFEVARALSASNNIHVMRDPTRGGIATTLNEIAKGSQCGIEINEEDIPIKLAVKKMCHVLGFDALYIANEGKFICFVSQKDQEKVKHAIGPRARCIGHVVAKHKGQVYLKTQIGTNRILPMLESDPLPRIC